MNDRYRLSPEAELALKENRPVVALESTIISHGMPYPKNAETALHVEKVIREHGGVPVTIGIIDGVGVIGMTPEEIEEFGRRGTAIPKVSRRDLPMIRAAKSWGATTVASTMIFAHMAGVKFFVTGGIGGVHRGAGETFDISADLEELGRTPVTVICAGAKAILDLPKTLEVLETKGVPVLGFQTDTFPAFYSRSSGLKTDCSLRDYEEAASVVTAKYELGLDGGILIANPIPEEDSIPQEKIDSAIEQTIREMNRRGIRGKECTPFLLAETARITEGESLAANIRLIVHNAAVGTEIAKAYCAMEEQKRRKGYDG